MFEIMSSICDEYGSRVVSTGDGSINEDVAYKKLEEWKNNYPDQDFFVEYNPSEDEWNSY